MVNFKEIYHFQGSRGGPTFSRRGGVGGGGPTFFRVVQLLIPIETHMTCDFPGGSGPPVPPSGSALGMPQSNKFNPFKPNGISHSQKLDQSISVLRVAGWYFLNFLLKFK